MRSEVITSTEFKITSAAVAASATNVIPAGNVVIATRVGLGKVCLLGQPTAINQDLRGIVPRDPGRLTVKYLFWWLKSVAHLIEKEGTGATVQGVKLPFIKSLGLPLRSVSEQQRIVAMLDETFEDIAAVKANAERNVHNARELFESFLAAVFSSRRRGWTDRRLDTLCQRITVGHVGSMARLYKPSGIPFLRSQNIRPFSVSMENMVYIDEVFHDSLGKSSLSAGDVAIVRTGYPGTAAVIPQSLGVANCSDLVIVRPGPEIDAHFLTAFFNSAFGKSLVSNKVVGSAQKHFNVGAAKDVVIHLPPVPEQQVIVAASNKLRDETDRLEGLYARKLTALAELKHSLLREAFAGELKSVRRKDLAAAVA